MTMLCRARPLTAQAVRYTGDNAAEVYRITGLMPLRDVENPEQWRGFIALNVGDWVVRTPHGWTRFTNAQFYATYEPLAPS